MIKDIAASMVWNPYPKCPPGQRGRYDRLLLELDLSRCDFRWGWVCLCSQRHLLYSFRELCCHRRDLLGPNILNRVHTLQFRIKVPISFNFFPNNVSFSILFFSLFCGCYLDFLPLALLFQRNILLQGTQFTKRSNYVWVNLFHNVDWVVNLYWYGEVIYTTIHIVCFVTCRTSWNWKAVRDDLMNS